MIKEGDDDLIPSEHTPRKSNRQEITKFKVHGLQLQDNGNGNDIKNQEKNPFLIFFSPDESEKSPFRRKRKFIYKEEHRTASAQRAANEKMKEYEREQKDEPKQSICFTRKIWRSKSQMGMLFISKFRGSKKNSRYSIEQRTIINPPICHSCNRLFINHSALGGHLRVCK